ncbi:MAG: KamA family radical SAM protein [Acidobacteria bacterium]|nr:KamA family radical SAM protein [Acidobacteriota bacterium]
MNSMDDDISSSENDEPPGTGFTQPSLPGILLSTAFPSKDPFRRHATKKMRAAPRRSVYTGVISFTVKTDPHKRACRANSNAFVSGERALHFRREHFPGISDREWNDWRWQLANRIRDLAGLERILCLSDEERRAISEHTGSLPVAFTPYYASLLDRTDPLQPLRRTVVKSGGENLVLQEEEADPLNEDGDSPVPGLVHRYPDRVLLLTTGFCSVYCRYCTRSRLVGNHGTETGYNMKHWEDAAAYIEQHREIRDVVLSGGDPLTLPDGRIEWLLERLRRISHVEIIRIGTKIPAVLPQRITPALVRTLRRYHPLWMSLHFTHPEELTPETALACGRLADAGIPLGSQTVLLKGVNDSVETMTRLNQGLLKIRVRPYYLYQCDPVQGSSHFRTTVEKGLEIIAGLRGHTSGYAVPHYVIDAPGGGGKIPLLPNYMENRDGANLVLKNYKGNLYRYPDPVSPAQAKHPSGDARGEAL